MQKSPKNVVIIGVGKTGLSCLRFCQQQGWPVAVTDSRANPPNAAQLKNIPTAFGKISAELIANADLLIISPGVSLQEPAIQTAIKRGVDYIGDIELFARTINAPIIAITGSNAKSTVTTLVGEMARCDKINVQVAGNIGTPVLDLMQQPPADLYVLELSSFQLETTFSLRAKVATVLNICEDHLDRHINMQQYIDSKMKVYQNCKTAVFNRAENFYQSYKLNFTNAITFGLDAPDKNQYGILCHNGEKYLAKDNKTLLNIKQLKLNGQHNLENALAALAIGDGAGLSLNAMLTALKAFSGLPHRCQLVRKINNVSWYNDSKGTNVGATMAALEGLGKNIAGKIILIAGGIGKNADFSALKPAIKKYVRKLILIGEASEEMAKIFNYDCNIQLADNLKQAVDLSFAAALPNDIVLLSPACASFDMFDDYQHRGNEFIKLVEQLAGD